MKVTAGSVFRSEHDSAQRIIFGIGGSNPTGKCKESPLYPTSNLYVLGSRIKLFILL